MSTIASRTSYNEYINSGTKKRKDNKVLTILKNLGGSATTEQVCLEWKRTDSGFRDPVSLLVNLYMTGRLNCMDKPVRGENGKLQSTYYIPDVPLTREQVLLRQLVQAKSREVEVQNKIKELETEIQDNARAMECIKKEYSELFAKLNRGEGVNKLSLRRLEKLRKALESGHRGKIRLKELT